MTASEILVALRDAVPDGYQVKFHADLEGASVLGPRVEAYVYPLAQGGYQVDLWHHQASASDAFRTYSTADLADAVGFAVRHAVIAHQRRGGQR